MLQTTIAIKIGGDEFPMSYPNVRQKIQIENLKLFLTGGKYGDLARSGHITAKELLDLVDAVSYFTVLNTKLQETLKIDDFENMEAIYQKRMVSAYKTQFVPWFDNIEEELNKDEDKDETPAEQ